MNINSNNPVRKAMIFAPLTIALVAGSFMPFSFNMSVAHAETINIDPVNGSKSSLLPYNNVVNLQGIEYNTQNDDRVHSFVTQFNQGDGQVREDWTGDVKTTLTANRDTGIFEVQPNKLWTNDYSGGGDFTLDYDFSGLKNGVLPAGTIFYVEDTDTGTPEDGESGTWSAPGETEKWAEYVVDMNGYYGYDEDATNGAKNSITYDDVTNSFKVNNTGNGANEQRKSTFVTTKDVKSLQLRVTGPSYNTSNAGNSLQFGLAAPIDSLDIPVTHKVTGDEESVNEFKKVAKKVNVGVGFNNENSEDNHSSANKAFDIKDLEGKYKNINLSSNKNDKLNIEYVDGHVFLDPKDSQKLQNYDWETTVNDGLTGSYNNDKKIELETHVTNIGPFKLNKDDETTKINNSVTFTPGNNDNLRKVYNLYLVDPHANPDESMWEGLTKELILDEGTFAIDDNTNSVTFTPIEGYTGKVPTIKYYVDDGRQTSTFDYGVNYVNQPKVKDIDEHFSEYLSTIDVNVTPEEKTSTPVAQEDNDKAVEGQPTVINVLNNDNAGENAEISKVEILNNDNVPVKEFTNETGTLTVNDDNTFTYTSAKGFHGVATFNYRLTNNFNNYADAVLKVTVDGQDNPIPNPEPSNPTILAAEEDQLSTSVNTTVNFQTLLNDTLSNGATWKDINFKNSDGVLSKEINVEGGKFVIQDDLSVTFTPDKDYTGPVERVNYVATDSNGNVAESFISLNVGTVVPDDENNDNSTDNNSSNNNGNNINSGNINNSSDSTNINNDSDVQKPENTYNNTENPNVHSDENVAKTANNPPAEVKTGGEVMQNNKAIGIALAFVGIVIAGFVGLRKKFSFSK